MYSYESMKDNLFSEDGQVKFLSIRDRSKDLLNQAGAFRLQEVINKEAGDSFLMLACIDRLVELREIREVTNSNVASQHRVFVAAGADV